MRAGCCSARVRRVGWVRARVRWWVGTRPAARGAGSLRSMRNETSSAAARFGAPRARGAGARRPRYQHVHGHAAGARAWSRRGREWVLSLKCCGALLYLKVELHCSSCCSSTLNKNAVQLHAALDSSYLKWHQCDSALVLVHHQELCRRRNQPMACRPQSPSPRPAVKQKQKARA